MNLDERMIMENLFVNARFMQNILKAIIIDMSRRSAIGRTACYFACQIHQNI